MIAFRSSTSYPDADLTGSLDKTSVSSDDDSLEEEEETGLEVRCLFFGGAATDVRLCSFTFLRGIGESGRKKPPAAVIGGWDAFVVAVSSAVCTLGVSATCSPLVVLAGSSTAEDDDDAAAASLDFLLARVMVSAQGETGNTRCLTESELGGLALPQ